MLGVQITWKDAGLRPLPVWAMIRVEKGRSRSRASEFGVPLGGLGILYGFAGQNTSFITRRGSLVPLALQDSEVMQGESFLSFRCWVDSSPQSTAFLEWKQTAKGLLKIKPLDLLGHSDTLSPVRLKLRERGTWCCWTRSANLRGATSARMVFLGSRMDKAYTCLRQ